MLRNVCGHRHLCPLDCLWTPTIQEDLANGRPNLDCHSSFYFWFGLLGRSLSRQFPGAVSSLRSVAGPEAVLDESCGIDVEDELVPELEDTPGTTRGTKLSVFHNVFLPCLVHRGFWTLTHSFLWRFWKMRRRRLNFNKRTKRSFLRILELVKTLVMSHAALRAHLSWCKVSSRDFSSSLCAQGLRSWDSHFLRDGPFLSRTFKRCHVPLKNLTAWFDPNFPFSRGIGFLGWESWDTQPIVQTPSIMQLILSHNLSLTSCLAFPPSQHVGNRIYCHICILVSDL